jgi:hypothetical protein
MRILAADSATAHVPVLGMSANDARQEFRPKPTDPEHQLQHIRATRFAGRDQPSRLMSPHSRFSS